MKETFAQALKALLEKHDATLKIDVQNHHEGCISIRVELSEGEVNIADIEGYPYSEEYGLESKDIEL